MRTKTEPRSAGFTLIEMVVVIAFMGVLMLIGIPAIQNLLHRSKLEGAARESMIMMQQARLEAIKRNDTTIVLADATNRRVVSFIDEDGDAAFDAGETVLGQLQLGSGITFTDPAGNTGDAAQTFTGPTGPLFEVDGSVAETGALRFADQRGNFLEVVVEPAATGRVRLRKWDGAAWREPGEGGTAWEWK